MPNMGLELTLTNINYNVSKVNCGIIQLVHLFLFKGIYSCRKSHVLYLSVPIQLLLAEFEAIKEVSFIK